jgi:hypothetical protein
MKDFDTCQKYFLHCTVIFHLKLIYIVGPFPFSTNFHVPIILTQPPILINLNIFCENIMSQKCINFVLCLQYFSSCVGVLYIQIFYLLLNT